MAGTGFEPEAAVRPVHALEAGTPVRGVLHVVGRLTEAVFHLLGPMTQALAAEGHPQTLLLVDDATGRQLAPRLHAGLQVVWAPEGRTGVERLLHLARRMGRLVDDQLPGWAAVHLHGLVPVVLGAPLARRLERMGSRVFVSPHNSRSLRSLRWLGQPLLGVLKHLVPLHRYRTIANVPFDVRALQRMASMPARLIESPVADLFFQVAHQVDAPTPIVVASAPADAPAAAERCAQLAVLLADGQPGLRFRWIAAAAPATRAMLEAAGVEVMPAEQVDDPYHRAHALAEATLFLAPAAGQGFPMALAEAMAVGLPCVADAVPAHHDMVVHRETAVLASGIAALSQSVAELLASPMQRQALARAARRDAMLRFSDEAFRRHVLAAFRREQGA